MTRHCINVILKVISPCVDVLDVQLFCITESFPKIGLLWIITMLSAD